VDLSLPKGIEAYGYYSEGGALTPVYKDQKVSPFEDFSRPNLPGGKYLPLELPPTKHKTFQGPGMLPVTINPAELTTPEEAASLSAALTQAGWQVGPVQDYGVAGPFEVMYDAGDPRRQFMFQVTGPKTAPFWVNCGDLRALQTQNGVGYPGRFAEPGPVDTVVFVSPRPEDVFGSNTVSIPVRERMLRADEEWARFELTGSWLVGVKGALPSPDAPSAASLEDRVAALEGTVRRLTLLNMNAPAAPAAPAAPLPRPVTLFSR
jgi:hypothetical protein